MVNYRKQVFGGMNLKSKELFNTILFFIGLAALLFLLRQFVFTPVVVKGHSMDPTLADGERVIALKNTEIKRFDIVTFPAPDEPKKSYIKRVIGLPGDTVEYKGDVLYINGKEVKEPYLDEFKSEVTDGSPLTLDFTLSEVTGEKKVPEGEYFVMGDNRRNSKDGRMIGFINKKDISGDVKFVLWPLNRFGTI
ncbi:signal peptidase I [Enterococcus caccae ATCC BAA-1240]|uniref:Signal peptidase I n=2 Tax=Enterococcus caccae TaxID=317735 RepID=R3W9C9_9ENTE|nr:signal peptidase I [Enterococcus caccae ATCC BAA-1240]EOT68413.1 signal peptidase I [Enterococcus caccae ATCC BAA-1240]OJG28378.1 signal peptidase I [Enterococcus caccae]